MPRGERLDNLKDLLACSVPPELTPAAVTFLFVNPRTVGFFFEVIANDFVDEITPGAVLFELKKDCCVIGPGFGTVLLCVLLLLCVTTLLLLLLPVVLVISSKRTRK